MFTGCEGTQFLWGMGKFNIGWDAACATEEESRLKRDFGQEGGAGFALLKCMVISQEASAGRSF